MTEWRKIGSTEKGRRTNSLGDLFSRGRKTQNGKVKAMPQSQTPKQGNTKRTLSITDYRGHVHSS